jgi:Domain of unknown function (DUF4190)
MGTPPSELPRAQPATQIAGQQAVPSTTVPMAGPGVALSMAPPNNTLAVVSLVAGILSFFGHIVPFLGGFTLALIAIIAGHVARNQIKRTGEGGSGFAIAGMVIGYIHIAILGLIFVFFFGLVMAILTGMFGAISRGG